MPTNYFETKLFELKVTSRSMSPEISFWVFFFFFFNYLKNKLKIQNNPSFFENKIIILFMQLCYSVTAYNVLQKPTSNTCSYQVGLAIHKSTQHHAPIGPVELVRCIHV